MSLVCKQTNESTERPVTVCGSNDDEESLVTALYKYTQQLHKEQVEIRDKLESAVKRVKKMKRKFGKTTNSPVQKTFGDKRHVLDRECTVDTKQPQTVCQKQSMFSY